MSMSMSMSLEKIETTPTPTSSPSAIPAAATQAPVVAPTPTPTSISLPSRVGCDEQTQTVFSFDLEVETAIGKTTFSDDLIQALNNALAAEYSFCSPQRSNERKLEDASFLLGDITVIESTTGK